MRESLSAHQRRPSLAKISVRVRREVMRGDAYLENNLVRLAELDELRTSHERMQVDLIDCRKIFRFRVDELLQMLDPKVPVRRIQRVSRWSRIMTFDGESTNRKPSTYDTPILLTLPASFASQHPLQVSTLTWTGSSPSCASGPCIKYKSM